MDAMSDEGVDENGDDLILPEEHAVATNNHDQAHKRDIESRIPFKVEKDI
jgi:hypothetical protein